MWSLARTAGIRMSPVVAVIVALTVLSPAGTRAIWRAMASTGSLAQAAMDSVRDQIEPAIFIGGVVVSRSRHIIAGAVIGCGAGATVGAGGAAALGFVTGGVGFAAIPPAAGIGCLVGGVGGVALGYPLDTWTLALE